MYRYSTVEIAKRNWGLVAGLFLKGGKVDSFAGKAWGRAGFQTAELEAGVAEGVAQSKGRGFAHAARWEGVEAWFVSMV